MKIISKYIKLGNHKIFLKLYLFFVFLFILGNVSISLSGDSIVLLNSHGVRGKKMSHTQYECIHKGVLSTYIDIDFFSFLTKHIGLQTTLRLLYTFLNIYTHTHYIHTCSHIHSQMKGEIATVWIARQCNEKF